MSKLYEHIGLNLDQNFREKMKFFRLVFTSQDKESFRFFEAGITRETYKPLTGKYLEILKSK